MVEGRTHRPVIAGDLCETCSVCIRGCPAEIIPEYRKEKTSLRGALYSGPIIAARPKTEPILAPCQEACPLHQKTRDYVRLIAQGRFLDALDLIREELPFPGIIGRICHNPCEEACVRGEKLDEPVSLCALKRFVADYEVGRRDIPAPGMEEQKGKNVAIIGGGPSGMTCAFDLRRAGYGVTLFDAYDRLGGMLYAGVPAYRLPRNVLEREVSVIEKAGVEVRCGVRVGSDISLREIHGAFDAVYIACGAQKGARLGLENEDMAGVLGGVEFLKAVAKGVQHPRFNEAPDSRFPVSGLGLAGKNVLVIGGGNVAVDAALTAKRLGAGRVGMVCLEKRGEMPAGKWEREQILEEGIKTFTSWGPKAINVANGNVTSIECKKCVSVFDRQGRFNPVYHERTTKLFGADVVIVAIGQSPDPDFLKSFDELERTEGGWVKADPLTLETNIPGIFAGGDIVSGPRMAIDAIADGKKAALSIGRYLREH